MKKAILVLNAGSSSIKFAVYPASATTPPLLRGTIAGIGDHAVLSARDSDGLPLPTENWLQFDRRVGHREIIQALLAGLQDHEDGFDFVAAGHRVVHGGRSLVEPALVDQALIAELDKLVPLAPLHQPHALAAIRAVATAAPDLTQIACFDTSFHRTQDRYAQIFALPRKLTDAGIIRYGFHGLSYDYIASMLPGHLGDKADGRVIVAHLGNGASMCAMLGRRSVATSMGFTALDGLMMGRRCGSIDPGVLLHFVKGMGMTIDEVEHLLYEQSGLFGVSGISNDVQILQNSPAPEAKEAVELFCYRAAAELAGLVAAIGGLDAIVFTAGIGENSALVRQLICARLGWLGMTIDAAANENHHNRINTKASKVDVLIVPTNEEIVIARATRTFMD